MLIDKIQELKKKIMEMAVTVEKMVSYSFEGIEKGKDRFDEVFGFEQRVNQMEMQIEDECIFLIALHHPEAKDLRLILMIYKINNDLERLGDQAYNIAESVAKMIGSPVVQLLPDLINMKKVTLEMLTKSIDAYTNEDVDKAQKVCLMDDVVDGFNRTIYNQVVELIKENPLDIENYMHILRIAKNLERVADLSTNISENTIYLVQGRVIKHHFEENSPKNKWY